MNKRQFLDALGRGLRDLPFEEQDKWLDFYSEMIDDRMEEGLSEEEAVAAIGSVEQVTAQILQQSQPVKKKKSRRELKTWQVVLLIVGSPIWFALLIVAVSVVFTALVTVWSVIIGFYAAAVSLVACGFAGLLLPALFLVRGYTGAALFLLGGGLFCGGLGIAWFIGNNYLAKGIAWLCKKLFSLCFRRKEAAQ